METQCHIVKYLEKDEKIVQFLAESDEYFSKRLEFIKILEKENINWKEAVKLSKIFMNIKYKKCKYVSPLYNKLKKYLI